MAAVKVVEICGLIFLSLILQVACERTKDKMYKPINGTYFCFKRLTAFGEHGCTSSTSGDIGVVHFVMSHDDIVWFLDKADSGPYVVVLSFDFYVKDILMKFRDSGKVSGIIVYSNTSTPESPAQYSPDDTCPNRESGLDESCYTWNTPGNFLINITWGFPLVFVDSSESIDYLYQCFKHHNDHDRDSQSERSLCAVEILAHMLAAVDTRTCIRRSNLISNFQITKFCDPLGDYSVYLPLLPRLPGSQEPPRSVILVVARLDGSSMYDNKAMGAVSPVSSLVTLMAAIKHLHAMLPETPDTDKNVVFALLNGESFDYIGSSRLIYDMEQEQFPYQPQEQHVQHSPVLRLSQVGLVVELDQIDGSAIYVHSHGPITTADSKLASDFMTQLTAEGRKENLTVNPGLQQLPPSSAQRFLRADAKIPALVVSSYNATFTNKFYHSILDDKKNLKFTYLNGSTSPGNNVQTTISQASVAVAKALYNTIFTSPYSGTVTPDPELVDELLYCYLENLNCSIFRKASFQRYLPNRPAYMYVGVHGTNNSETTLTGQTLALFTGETVNLTRETCFNDSNAIYKYMWLLSNSENDTGVCIKSLVNYTLAQSPAFIITDYDWHSNNYSSWTESIWRQMSARVFLKPSKRHEVQTISIGLFVLILSFAVVYVINSKADILFNLKVMNTGGC